ncbi:MAG: methyltransferase domain-containing protein [Candidatus Omnitrophica bacterium]|nr:methyltransferase domain-containing protein [Candidatus Omnitrophota bacterium]
MDKKSHWETIYKTKSPKEVSWYSPRLEKSLEGIRSLGLPNDARLIDVGGGASTLPDDLIAAGFKNITVLDISKEALKVSRERLGEKARLIRWIEGDVTRVSLDPGSYDGWHDRAVFHFLTEADDRKKYVEVLGSSLAEAGHALIAVFGPNGPLKCSGLEIVRYSVESLQKELGEGFELKEHFLEMHKTPFDSTQEFLYCLFVKK